jgi:hypothetical protein
MALRYGRPYMATNTASGVVVVRGDAFVFVAMYQCKTFCTVHSSFIVLQCLAVPNIYRRALLVCVLTRALTLYSLYLRPRLAA